MISSLHKVWMLRVVFLALVVLSLFSAPNVHAAPTDDYDNWSGGNVLPTAPSQYINISEGGSSGNYADTGGTYSYETSEAWVKIYTKTQNLKGISIQFTDRGIGQERACEGYDLRVDEYRINENGLTSAITAANGHQQYSISPNGNGIPCNVYRNLRINSSSFTPSGAPEHQGLYVAVIKFSIRNSGCGSVGAGANACKTPSFRLQMDNFAGSSQPANADAKLAIAGEGDVYYQNGSSVDSSHFNRPVNPNSDLFANGISIYPSRNQQTHSFHYSFKPPCVVSGGSSFSVKLIGLDTGSPNQTQYRIPNTNTIIPSGNNLTVRITRANGTTPNLSTSLDSNGGYIAVDDDQFDTTYVLTISGITGGNGIRVVLPFDSGSGKFSCPPPSAGSDVMQVECSRVRVPSRHTFHDTATRYQIVAADRPISRSEAGSFPRSPYWGPTVPSPTNPNNMLGIGGANTPEQPNWWNFDGVINGVNRYQTGQKVYFYYVGMRGQGTAPPAGEITMVDAGSNAWQAYEFDPKGVTPFAAPGSRPFKEACFPPNWFLQTYSGSSADYIELGRGVTFGHSVFNRGPDTANGISGGVKANYDLGNPAAGASGGANDTNNVFGVDLGTISPGDSNARGFGPYGVNVDPSATNLLGQNYCQRFYINPSRMINGNITAGEAQSDARCAAVVGGKSSLSTGLNGDAVIESGDEARFTASVLTSSFSASGAYTGYDVDCSYVVSVQVNSGAGRVNRASGSCDSRADGANTTDTTPVNYTANDPVGSRICMVATITGARSIVSPGGNDALLTGERSSEQCVSVVAKPYFRVFGGDVSAGNGYADGGACVDPNASVVGWNRNVADGGNPANGYRGAGVQYAVFAQNVIRGVASGQGVGQVPLPAAEYGTAPTKLSFANDTANLGSEIYGGKYSAGGCMSDFYGTPTIEYPWQSVRNADTIVQSANDEDALLNFGHTGNLTLSGGDNSFVAAGTNARLYVDGNLYLNTNITAEPNITSLSKIPSLTVIVKGNIYVAPGVTQLYGTYIAQQKGNTGGNIYTCGRVAGGGFEPVPNAETYETCNSRLTVVGSFVAERISLMRTNGSAIRDTSGYATGASVDNAAEVFYYNPLFWLRQGVSGGISSKDITYDAITALPPVL